MKVEIRVSRCRWVDKAYVYINDIMIDSFADPFKEVESTFQPIISRLEHIEAALFPNLIGKMFSSERERNIRKAIGIDPTIRLSDPSYAIELQFNIEREERLYGGLALIYANDVLIGTRSLRETTTTDRELIESIFLPDKLSCILNPGKIKNENANLKKALIVGLNELDKRMKEEEKKRKERKKALDEFVAGYHSLEMMQLARNYFG